MSSIHAERMSVSESERIFNAALYFLVAASGTGNKSWSCRPEVMAASLMAARDGITDGHVLRSFCIVSGIQKSRRIGQRALFHEQDLQSTNEDVEQDEAQQPRQPDADKGWRWSHRAVGLSKRRRHIAD